MKIIGLKIDVSKIDKSKLFKGKKGVYLDATLLLNDEVDQYGNNGMIVQSISKEEREAGAKGVILGNCKEIISEPVNEATVNEAPVNDISKDLISEDDDDLPF